MFCNTHVTFADKLQLDLSHGTHYCHFHMTSENPRTSIPCSNSDVIKSWHCFLFSISLASCSCPSLHSCVSHSCIHCLAVFPLTSSISLTNALFPDSVIRLHSCMLFDMFESWLWLFFSLSTWPLVTPISLWTSKLWFPNFRKYSSFNIKLYALLYYVKMFFSALHYSTWSWEGFRMLASAHALCLTTSYSCPSISGAFWGLQGFPDVSEVVQEFGRESRTEHSPKRGECRAQVGS